MRDPLHAANVRPRNSGPLSVTITSVTPRSAAIRTVPAALACRRGKYITDAELQRSWLAPLELLFQFRNPLQQFFFAWFWHRLLVLVTVYAKPAMPGAEGQQIS